MKILNPHAQPVESQLAQRFQVRLRRHPRIDLDPDLRVRRKFKPLGRKPEKLFHLPGHQIRRRPAAPVKLHHRPFARHKPADVLDLPLQRLDVRRRNAVILRDHHVARAKQAQAFAEGKMHVQRHRSPRRVGRRVILLQIVRPEIILPHRRRRVTRVPRPRPVVFFQELFGNLEAFPVQLQMQAGIAHSENYRAPSRRTFSATAALCPASTNARAFSTGVCCKIPCPRFKMCPIPPVCSTAA